MPVCSRRFPSVLVAGCDYDFPLTAQPTRKIDERLLGDWVGVDQQSAKEDLMRVRGFDDSTYAVAIDNDIYRVFHSDFAGTPLVSVQDLNSGNRKYLYFAWRLSTDGNQLSLKGIDPKVIPETTKSASDVQHLIKQQLKNPRLFRDELRFTRKQAGR